MIRLRVSGKQGLTKLRVYLRPPFQYRVPACVSLRSGSFLGSRFAKSPRLALQYLSYQGSYKGSGKFSTRSYLVKGFKA